MQNHDEAKPFKCEHCQMAFIHDCQLKAHSEIHITERNHLCSKCLQSFPSERLLNAHENIHTEHHKKKLLEANKYFCSLDNCTNTTGYRSEKDLERHIMSHTGEPGVPARGGGGDTQRARSMTLTAIQIGADIS